MWNLYYLYNGPIACACNYQLLKTIKIRYHIHSTFGFQHLSRSLRSVGKCQGNNLIKPWEFDLEVIKISILQLEESFIWRHTLSSMTRGPFTPPIVLYRILGWTVVMRGSSIPGAMATCQAKAIARPWNLDIVTSDWAWKIVRLREAGVGAWFKVKLWP